MVFIHVNEKTKLMERNTRANNLFADDVNVPSTVFEFKTSLHHPTPNPHSLLFLFHVTMSPFSEDLRHVSVLLSTELDTSLCTLFQINFYDRTTF